MTEKRIAQLAYHAAIQIWAKEDERLKEDPTSEVAQAQEKRTWKEVEEIRAILKRLEDKESR